MRVKQAPVRAWTRLDMPCHRSTRHMAANSQDDCCLQWLVSRPNPTCDDRTPRQAMRQYRWSNLLVNPASVNPATHPPWQTGRGTCAAGRRSPACPQTAATWRYAPAAAAGAGAAETSTVKFNSISKSSTCQQAGCCIAGALLNPSGGRQHQHPPFPAFCYTLARRPSRTPTPVSSPISPWWVQPCPPPFSPLLLSFPHASHVFAPPLLSSALPLPPPPAPPPMPPVPRSLTGHTGSSAQTPGAGRGTGSRWRSSSCAR